MSFPEFGDNGLPDGLVDRRTVYDDLEPIESPRDDLRDAALKYVALINAFGSRIESALASSNLTTVAAQFWGCALALNLNCCDGRSMTEISQSLGIERATVSKHAVAFCLANGIDPSIYMKSADSAEIYATRRIESITKHNGNGKLPAVPARGMQNMPG